MSIVKGPWAVGNNVYVKSYDFDNDVSLVVYGEFKSDEHREAYAQELCDILNKHNEGK